MNYLEEKYVTELMATESPFFAAGVIHDLILELQECYSGPVLDELYYFHSRLIESGNIEFIEVLLAARLKVITACALLFNTKQEKLRKPFF